MIFPNYLESFKDIVFRNKKKSQIQETMFVNCGTKSFTQTPIRSNISDKQIKLSLKKDHHIKFDRETFEEDTIYESIENITDQCCLSRSAFGLKSPKSSTKNENNKETISSTPDMNISDIKHHESRCPINKIIDHKCSKTKVLESIQSNDSPHKLNNIKDQSSSSEQKCIHQLHPECLNLSTADDGCLVCNALIVGQKYEQMNSFSESTKHSSRSSPLASNEDHDMKTNSSCIEKRSHLLNELAKLNRAGWYWGKMSRFEAEDKLMNTPVGTFLIRDSFDRHYLLSLSFRIEEGVFHTRIEYRNDHFHFYLHPHKKYQTVSSLVDNLILSSKTGIYYYVKSAKTNKEIRFTIKLDKPLSRHSQIRSLKYLCRFVIKQNIRYDLINDLPVPDSIEEYLDENHF